MGMSRNDVQYYCNAKNGEIFARFPELIPAEGDYYCSDAHTRLLLVIESNYFKDVSDDESCFRNPQEWYEGSPNSKLIPRRYVDMVKCWKYDYRPFRRAIDIANSLLKNPHPTHDYNTGKDGAVAQNEIAFYNYFLRPADADKSLEFTPGKLDLEYAAKAMDIVIEKLQPDLVIFLSSKSFHAYDLHRKENNVKDGLVIEHVVHPSCIWWNRDGGVYGKNKLKELLKKHWLIEDKNV